MNVLGSEDPKGVVSNMIIQKCAKMPAILTASTGKVHSKRFA